MKSRSGIYYTLADSPYKLNATINTVEIELRFSSEKHRLAFREAACKIPTGYAVRYDFVTEFYILEIFRQYRRIETRGFYAIVNGEVITCPDQLIFTDRVQIKPSGER